MDASRLQRLQAAEALANTGRLTEAEADCRAVREEAPEPPEALALLGIITARMDRFEEARGLLESAIRHRTDVPQWFYELARLHQRSFRLADALDAAWRAVPSIPTTHDI